VARADLPNWLADELESASGPGSIADVERVRAFLIGAAGEARAVSYSELLGQLGHRFTRPKMRALCRTLDAIDTRGAAAGEPELAVLVVRESDRLPGQGWWTGRTEALGYKGAWNGPEAQALVRQLQQQAFAYWMQAGATASSFRS
jgi:hypothetical protein